MNRLEQRELRRTRRNLGGPRFNIGQELRARELLTPLVSVPFTAKTFHSDPDIRMMAKRLQVTTNFLWIRFCKIRKKPRALRADRDTLHSP